MTRRYTRLWTLAVIGAMLLSACAGGDRTTSLNASDSGTEISIDAGDRLEIVLDSNPSTGYSWSIDQGTTDIVNLVTSTFEADDTADRVGGGGTETFVFEAPNPGAGILRLAYIRPFDDPPIPERVVEYVISVDGVPWTRDGSEPTTVSTSAEPSDGVGETIGIAALFDGEGPREAIVEGFVLVDSSGARLCEVLMESFPPQCGGLSLVIANPSGLDPATLTEAQGVQWTDQVTALAGRFDGDRFVLEAGADESVPTPADEALVDAFLAHAGSLTEATAQALPFADVVSLGLGTEILASPSSALLADPESWRLDIEEYAGFVGPFSALDVAVAGGGTPPVVVTIGAHPHCAGPPRPAPAGFEGLRRVSVQPETATSCIEWWTVDFFVDDTDTVQAVTLDLFGP